MKAIRIQKVRKTISAGGLIAQERHGDVFVLLVRIKRRNLWTIPKGHLETGEQLHDAARREVAEEANATKVRILGRLGCFQRMANHRREHKTIHYFLMTPTALENYGASSDQHFDRITWWPLDRAPHLALPEHNKVLAELRFRLSQVRHRLWSPPPTPSEAEGVARSGGGGKEQFSQQRVQSR